jgi:hypothetical protein
MYGFSNNLLEHMAVKTLQSDTETRFSLEDVFARDGDGAARLAWVAGWRRLPHISPEVLKLYEYPQQFAEAVFKRIEDALDRRVSRGDSAAAAPIGHLYVVAADEGQGGAQHAQIPELPVEYFQSSDRQVVAAGKAGFRDQAGLLHDRHEGMFAVSYRTQDGWVAISKDFLTDVLGAGRDARVVGLPVEAAAVLRLMCPGLVAGAA